MSLLQRVRAPFTAIGRAYNQTAQKNPWSTGIITTVLKTSAADMFAQKVIEGKDEMDWKRHGMFCAFGFAYLGCFQYWLYNNLFSKICRPITNTFGHWGSAPVKTFIDQCIHHPIAYFPSFYLLKGAVEGRSVESSMAKCKEDLWDNCLALWKIWVPAQLFNFAVVPAHLRIPFVALVSFAWTVVISVMRGALDHHDKSSAVEQTTAAVASAASSAASAAAAAATAKLTVHAQSDSTADSRAPLSVGKATL